MHVGSSWLQFPEGRHLRFLTPFILYPSLHLYFALLFNFPDAFTKPLTIGAGFGHLMFASKKRVRIESARAARTVWTSFVWWDRTLFTIHYVKYWSNNLAPIFFFCSKMPMIYRYSYFHLILYRQFLNLAEFPFLCLIPWIPRQKWDLRVLHLKLTMLISLKRI